MEALHEIQPHFLKAKKEERGELLEKITGTGIYRRLGIRAFEKNPEANREIQEQQLIMIAAREGPQIG